jgi:two-component system chemotaxis response regulator CheB
MIPPEWTLIVKKIRILIVDDSVVVRRTLSDELSRDPSLEVIGTAANGKIALARMGQVNPDLVILDVEMPEMDGLATLRELRKIYPKLPVIMFSSHTVFGAAITVEALMLGASDYFAKPSNTGGLEASLQLIRNELIPSIKALCPLSPVTPSIRKITPRVGMNAKIEIVVIGTSTGGPNALAELFKRFPSTFPVPILIVQHMPATFTKLLAERISANSAINVREASTGDRLMPGHCWIAPGNHHLAVERVGSEFRLLTNQDPPENSCRPAADVLFRSVASQFGPSTLGVVMTGMGQDGLRGCEAIREAGGQILVQDEESSVVWGMPGAVARAGLADRVLPLTGLGDEIIRRVTGSRTS